MLEGVVGICWHWETLGANNNDATVAAAVVMLSGRSFGSMRLSVECASCRVRMFVMGVCVCVCCELGPRK